MSELLRVLGALAEPPCPQTDRLSELLGLPAAPAAADWTELFVFELAPYASIYVGAEGMIGGDARDHVAGFWRALGLVPPTEPDHLSALLAFYASLSEFGDRRSETARRALFHEHLNSWLPLYLAKVEAIAPTVYRAWGRLLTEALAAEVDQLGPYDRLALHLREAPPLEHPNEVRVDAFVDQLLTPVRSGMIVTRLDLRHAARDLGLGLRAGERRQMLRVLLGQDPAAVLDWLAAYAQVSSLRAAGFWRTRAETAAVLLSTLARMASRFEPTPA
jgi:TorA maturation chaperone TorD